MATKKKAEVMIYPQSFTQTEKTIARVLLAYPKNVKCDL